MGYLFNTGSGDGREWKNHPGILIVDYHDGASTSRQGAQTASSLLHL
jgi:hypothetical protein